MSKEQKQRTFVGLMSVVVLCVAALSIRFTVNTVAQTPGDADAQIADADGDGVKDYEEAAHGTDPDNADSDGDGFFDDQELALARDPLDPNEYPDVETAVTRFDGPQNRSSHRINSEPSTAVSLVEWVQVGEKAIGTIVSKGTYSLRTPDL